MSEKFEARLGLNTDEYNAKLKGATNGVQTFAKSFKQAFSDQKGLIKSIENDIKKIHKQLSNVAPGKAQQKMFRELQGAQKALSEEMGTLTGMQNKQIQANIKGTKAANGFMGAIGKWALTLGGAAAAFKLVKEAIMQTTFAINTFNIAGAAMKQVMYNIVTGQQSWVQGVWNAVTAQKELNKVRFQDKIYTKAAKLEQVEYDKAITDAHDQMLTGKKRIEAYDAAMVHLTNVNKLQKGAVQEEIDALEKSRKFQQGDEKTVLRIADLKIKLIDLDHRMWSGQKEIASMRSGLVKTELKEQRELLEAYNTVNKARINNIVGMPKKGTPTSVFKPQKYGFSPDLPSVQDYGGSSDPEKAKAMADEYQAFLDTNPFGTIEVGLTESQQALIGLSDTFAGFFSDVNLGFEGMIDGVITGIKRLVMELMAKAAFLAILSAIFPGAGVALNLGTILGGNASKLIGSGGSGGKTSSASVGSASNMLTNSLVASLRGKDIQIALNRS